MVLENLGPLTADLGLLMTIAVVVASRAILVKINRAPWRGLRVEYIAFFIAFLVSGVAKLALDIVILITIGTLVPQSVALLLTLVDSSFIGGLGGWVWIHVLSWSKLAPKGQSIESELE